MIEEKDPLWSKSEAGDVAVLPGHIEEEPETAFPERSDAAADQGPFRARRQFAGGRQRAAPGAGSGCDAHKEILAASEIEMAMPWELFLGPFALRLGWLDVLAGFFVHALGE